jgi:hypothetical protein
MGQPQIVAALDHVVGELVGQAEAQAAGRSVRSDQIDAGDLRLLAAVLGEGG